MFCRLRNNNASYIPNKKNKEKEGPEIKNKEEMWINREGNSYANSRPEFIYS